MNDLSIVIPFHNGHATIERLLASIPADIPVFIVDDMSQVRLGDRDLSRGKVIRMMQRGYFTGAVNLGITQCGTDVLILNQDTYFDNDKWLKTIEDNRAQYGLIGEGIAGLHPAYPLGYIHGTFMFIRRDVIRTIGLMNSELYPLWGSTCEYQLRAARAGFEVLPLKSVPGFNHTRKGRYGSAIEKTLKQEPEREREFIRTPPEVSVVVTCYNYGRYLPDLVSSLLDQTFQSFEVVIVDDHSTDDSFEIAQSLADPWQGIRVIRHKENKGTAAAVNTGIKAAYGKYIARIDADDMMKPTRLADMYKLQLQNPHSFIFDDLILFGSDVHKYPGTKKINDDVVFPLPPYDFDKMIYKNGVHAGIFFPKQAWTDAGGYPEEMNKGREDWAFNVALGLKGYCGVKLDRPGYMYRRSGQNRTILNTNYVSQVQFREQMIRLYPELYRGVKPMGCCGSSKAQFKNGGSKVAGNSLTSLPGKDGWEILEYVGTSSGDLTWWGPVTGQRYVMGGNRKVSYVDKADAVSMLKLRDGGREVFRVYVKPPEPKVEVVETKELEPAGFAETYEVPKRTRRSRKTDDE